MGAAALGFGVGVLVGGAATGYVLLNLQPSASGHDAAARRSHQAYMQYHPALKYGIPTSGLGTKNLKFYDGFVAAFDTRTRNPAWVLEKIEWKDKYEEGVDRAKSRFYEDVEIEERFRNRMSDFYQSGYDRGHLGLEKVELILKHTRACYVMVPAGSHMYSQKAMDETFIMNNISPQVGKGFNRNYWARFEKFVKTLAVHSTAVYVVTGPLWLPKKDQKTKKWVMKFPMIGEPPSLISVPTHFYKVILAERKNGKTGVGAFVMPNEQIDPQTHLAMFATPIDDLECASGFKFFPMYLDDDRRRSLDSAALGWKDYGKKHKVEATGELPQLTDSKDGSRDGDSGGHSSAKERHDEGSEAIVAHAPGTSTDIAKPPNTGPFAKGAVHLCEQTKCVIPSEEFWLKRK